MALSGSLEDVPIIDLIQLLGVSGKSGVLCVNRRGKQAQISLQNGRIFSASLKPRLIYMSELLVERGDISLETLHRALNLQRSQKNGRKPIGAILIEMGEVNMRQLEDALRQQIQMIINELASWTDGEFSFSPGNSKPVDTLSFLPDSMSLNLDLSPQELLLEAVRIYDEAQRFDKQEPAPLRPGEQESELGVLDNLLQETDGEQPRPVILLSTDSIVRYSLKEASEKNSLLLYAPMTVEDTGHLLEELAGRSPLLVVDTDLVAEAKSNQTGIELLEALKQEWPDIATISFGRVDDPKVYTRALSLGTILHVPRPLLNASVEIVESFSQGLAQVIAREVSREEERGRPVPKLVSQPDYLTGLYQGILDLRRSGQSLIVSLEMLRTMAQYLERAILFLIHRQQLLGLGVFGLRESPLVAGKYATNLRIDLATDSIVYQAIKDKSIQRVVNVQQDAFLDRLYAIIGPPVRPDALLVPLVIWNRTVSIVYADNANRNIKLCPTELLGVLAEHAGLLLENLLMRRRFRRNMKDGEIGRVDVGQAQSSRSGASVGGPADDRAGNLRIEEDG